VTRQASCEAEQVGFPTCRSMNAILVERTVWPTYEVQYVRLCSRCRTRLGIAAPKTSTGNRYRLTEKAGGDRTHASD